LKKLLPLFAALAIIYSGCAKDHVIDKQKDISYNVSIAPSFNYAVNGGWQQVLGGEADIQFKPENSDTISFSSIKDSLDLSKIATYSWPLLQGIYDVSLSTNSKNIADTYIRFSAQQTGVVVNNNTTINLSATTNDGVITINDGFIASNTVPTFTPSGSTVAKNMAIANGYYFIYVSGASTGSLSFTEKTTGNLYLANITVAAMNQYDVSPVIDTSTISIHKNLFHLKLKLQ